MMITYIVPYYRQPLMLMEHLKLWLSYRVDIRECMNLLIVDDCSTEPAEPIVREWLRKYPDLPITLYRIKDDIKWNRNGARNLGSHVAKTPWLLHTDIDHLLPFGEADALINTRLDLTRWYRFERYRIGEADDTRRKDEIPDDAKYGKIKPHGDSYLCTRKLYWQVGGYDEDYSGHLGGGTPFLKQMSAAAKQEQLLIALHVYTKHYVKDASVSTLSRNTDEYTRLRKVKEQLGSTKAVNPLRFKWERIL